MASAVHLACEPSTAPDNPGLADLRTRLAGTNINEKTLLATDYLNHFNELVMVLDLIPDMPDCLQDAREWVPKNYEEHFADSQFSDATLAIEAYAIAPPEYKVPFETTVERLNRYIPRFLDLIEKFKGRLVFAQFQVGSREIVARFNVIGAVNQLRRERRHLIRVECGSMLRELTGDQPKKVAGQLLLLLPRIGGVNAGGNSLGVQQ